MSTRSPIERFASTVAAVVAFALCILFFGLAEAQEQGDEARESTTSYFDKGGRARTSLKATTRDSFAPLETEGEREKPGQPQRSSKLFSSEKVSNDFWIFHADVELFYDDDRDGHFYGIDVLFDADTYFEAADVYAVLYLSFEGGPWNEYAVTETFSIFGATSDDEYVVVTELMSGYPTGSYDLLIELYDTFDGALVAEMGPEHNPELAFLPLEDFNRDDPRRGGFHRHDHGGGAVDWATLALLGLVLLPAYRRSAHAGDFAHGDLKRPHGGLGLVR